LTQLELWGTATSRYWHDAPLIVRRLKQNGRVSITGHAFSLDEAHPWATSLRPRGRAWIEARGGTAWRKRQREAA
jgi:hypothetical protein